MVTISHQTNGKTNGTTKHNAFADIGGWPFIQDDRISWYQKNILSLTLYHCGYYTVSLINFLHLLQSIASSLCSCRIWVFFLQPHSKFSLAYLWVLQLSLYKSVHFLTQLFLPYLETCSYTSLVGGPLSRTTASAGTTKIFSQSLLIIVGIIQYL